ncbi:hypothetical protein I350_00559 [Cryptococcus amylolentus CBS 6273]|uniref:Prenyltransferase alpha-alpha toroid domain-containing protein n=1 Tax=Cryptococcus amylolentus CBS 6273 TaxID=1296118 RepID=A0A1E3KFH8_9TREE|nr:hypothetical protein I350_00559 [Cryptococcus amylolentus CBS 6273]
MEPPRQSTFKRNAHINYFRRCLMALPTAAEGHDSNRITIAYFCLSALDLLGALQDKTSEEQRNGWIDWIWTLQARKGSTYMTTPNASTSPAHLPSTYTALLSLAILRAPLDRLDRAGLVAFVRSCQSPNGSFSPTADSYTLGGFQSDARMAYCACAVSNMIGDMSGIDVPLLRQWIESCRTWEGGYGSRPGVIEAQGGTTYCSLTSLSLLDQDSSHSTLSLSSLDQRSQNDSTRWLVSRQIGGFQGRPGKLEDVCYSFWCGGALNVLGHGNLISHAENQDFLLSSQSPFGGFGKEPEDYPDPFHSYLALAALSLSSLESSVEQASLGLRELDVKWNCSRETARYLLEEIRRIKS